MSSGPHQMNIGWPEVRTNRTVTRRLCGHVSGVPMPVLDQSNALVRAPISPPPAKKSSARSPSFIALNPTSLFDNKLMGFRGRFKDMRRDVAARQCVTEFEAHEGAGGVARDMIVASALDFGRHRKPGIGHVGRDIRGVVVDNGGKAMPDPVKDRKHSLAYRLDVGRAVHAVAIKAEEQRIALRIEGQ